MAGSSKSAAPTSVAEGLGNVLRGITDTMQAPDAVQFAGELMKLQTSVLDLIHGGKHGQQGQQASGAPAPPGGGGAPPPGAGGPSPMGGGLAGMMGASQGPSTAVSGGGASSLSGMDPEAMRQSALIGADQ